MKAAFTFTLFVALIAYVTGFIRVCVINEAECDKVTAVCGRGILNLCMSFKNECARKRANCYKLIHFVKVDAALCTGIAENRLGFCRNNVNTTSN